MKTPFVTTLRKVFLSGLLIGLPGLSISHAQLAAFPGAEGTGAYAVGGRYGDVYHVTTLSGSGTTPGSYYYGIANAPAAGRTIVFDVSGYIHIGGTHNMDKPKITIAGQTAPGDGIGFKDGTFNIIANDCIIRHVRFRDGNSADSVDLGNNSNIIMDHCDVMFSNDENLSSFGTPPDNFTFQWCMNSWGMETHSCGGLWDQNHATCHHSLWSHNHTRNPKVRATLLDWVNNITFDWDIGFIMGDSNSGANWKANVRGSYFVSPPGNTRTSALEKALLDSHGSPNFSLYIDDCALDCDGDGMLSVTKTGYAIASGSYNTSATPYPNNGIPVTIDDALTAYKKVLSAAGPLRMDSDPARPLRDELNTILVNNVVQQRRFHVNAPSKTGASNGGFGTLNSVPPLIDTDRDGMPDYWESTLGSNPSLDDHINAVPVGAFVPTGYTRLEEYLQFLSMPHTSMSKATAAVPSAIDVNLRKYTLGFTNKLPVTFTISNVTNGTVTLVNGYLAHFVPPTDFYGRARFDFTVTDGDGSTWKQTFAVLVSIVPLPRDLLWTGDGASNILDTNSPNFLFGTNLTAFTGNDNVTFDDSGSASPAVNIIGTLAPSSLTVNSTNNYTLGGSGTLIGPMILKQSGGGTLTVNTANSFGGGGTIDSSTLVINGAGSNTGDIGNGAFTLQNANITSSYGGSSAYTLDNFLTIPDGTVSTINFSPRMTITGFSGSGVMNLNVSATAFYYDNLNGAYAGFNGILNVTGTVPGALLTGPFNGGAFDGNLANARVNLDNVAFVGRHNSGGNTLIVGALTGTATSGIQGSGYAGPLTVQVGGLNLDTVFAGTITNVSATNKIIKVGTGILTLSGTNNFAGALIVSNGTLRVTGSDAGNFVTVPASGTLDGTGLLLGGVTTLPGGHISPGLGIGSFGTLTTSNKLTFTSPNLHFDLPGSTSGAYDKIVMLGGTLAMSGVQNYLFNLTDLAFGEGVYNLIEGGTSSTETGVSIGGNLPGNTRQAISLYRSAPGANPAFVRLSVTGSASSLVWTGTNGAAWDLSVTTNWLNGAAPDGFYNLDSVRFDDTSTNGTVAISGTVQPVVLVVSNNTLPYTIGGGSIGGLGSLLKRGAAPLTLTGSNSFTGGATIQGGTVILANDLANQFGLGSGNVLLQDATLTMYSDSASYNVAYWNFQVPAGSTSRLNTDARCYFNGSLIGGGTLDYYVTYVRTELDGDWSGFTGRINVLVDADGGDFRINNAYGYANAAIHLAANAWAYHVTAGTTVAIGELSGDPGSVLANANWIVGSRNTDATFAGTIVDGGGITTLTKTGTGILTLTGASTNTGRTTVNVGALRVNNLTGSGTGYGDVSVASGATLTGSGSIAGLVSIADGGSLAPGNSAGTLTIGDGLVLGDGSTMNFELGTVSDSVNVTGDLTFGGTLNITNLSGFGVGVYTLFTYGGQLLLGHLTFGAKPAGYNYAINTSTSGQVKLVVAPTTPPNFGSLILNGGSLIFSGGNGVPLGNYYVISSTNIALPLANWTRVATNQFDAAGSFTFTNVLDFNSTQSFYLLQTP